MMAYFAALDPLTLVRALPGNVAQGLIWGIMALGVYITFRILDFPDLTVDGSFPLGAAITAALITRGINPYLTLLLAFLSGVLAGICTGLIHIKCKVRDLLSGIIMMTALWTINLYIAGTSNVPLFSQKTIFHNDLLDQIVPEVLSPYITLIIILILAMICKVLLDLYLQTKSVSMYDFQFRCVQLIFSHADFLFCTINDSTPLNHE